MHGEDLILSFSSLGPVSPDNSELATDPGISASSSLCQKQGPGWLQAAALV